MGDEQLSTDTSSSTKTHWTMKTHPGSQDKARDPNMSNIACQLCRRRKIRCGRELPHCQVCEKNGQTCEYPISIMKPGPKIGYVNINRKRKKRKDTNDDEPSQQARMPGDKSSPQKQGSMTDGETSSSVMEAPDLATDAHNMLQTTQSPKDNDVDGRRDSVNIQDLSFHLHPSHEASISNKASSPCSTHHFESEKSAVFTHAANAIGLAPDIVENLVKIYFENMTAINLFREPYFDKKLQSIEPPTVTHALLAAIVAFSSRFCSQEDSECDARTREALAKFGHPPSYFQGLASQLIDQAVQEFDSSAPPLSLLQAAILLAHGQLTQGVRGKAWRSLGTCVRIAYELNLHLVDSGYANETDEVDVELWCDHEEKRRAWWAIWEMDVFASTIRRCPTAIDWSQNETLLPVDDESWFRGKPQASCFLELDSTRRWSVIQRSGNHSAKAWFIVINSLMKDAQCISSPRSIPNLNLREDRHNAPNACKRQKLADAAVEEAREKLEILSNSVRCFVLALPAALRFRNQYLGFHARLPGQISARQEHCGLYNIYVMTQLATLMIHQYDVFGGPVRTGWARDCLNSRLGEKSRSHESPWRPPRGNSDTDIMALDQYFEAADNILTIVRRSSDNHTKWINAFLASTIWLAAAVQLVRKEFGPPGTNRGLVKSKFDVLYITYQKCVSWWDIQTALQQNLESLESQLHTFREENKRPDESRWQTIDRRAAAESELWTNEIQGQNDNRQADRVNPDKSLPANEHPDDLTSHRRGASMTSQGPVPQGQHSSESVSDLSTPVDLFNQRNPSTYLTQGSHKQDFQQQLMTINAEPISPATSSLDFMRLSDQVEKPVGSELVYQDPDYIDPGIFNPMGQDGQTINVEESENSLYIMGGGLGLSSYINELLSNGYM